VQKVMEFIFDGVEKGESFLDNATIAAALGMTPTTVRRAKSRGFQRLKEAAQHDGIDMGGVLEADIPDDAGEGDD
jgi:hypothetical protein